VEWMPFELRPEPQPTLRPEGEYLQNTWKKSVYPLAERFGVKMVLPRVSPQPHTRLAFEGFQYAKEHGKGEVYNHRMFTAFFQEEKDIGDIHVLTELAEELGLDGEDFRKALETGRYREEHRKALRHAYEEMNIQAVPTFVIGSRVLTGLYDADVLERVIEEELSRRSGKTRGGFACDMDGCD